ncbi:hypothetical protein [Mucilaginibacter sp. UYCu711]|uniref:hypothetical protein n=1 Tax=Mucilaginibacter sp. UYCu711 TaxID=3156339 RepID=UPI003D1DEE8F
MKVLLNIKDEKADFILEVLENFKDVKVTHLSTQKANILWGIKEAIEEVKLIQAEKLSGIPAKNILDEL